MDADGAERVVSGAAAAIGEPARTRMLLCLLDGRARTSTELAVVAEVSPSTASAHLSTLRRARLVRMRVQGRHRYYVLEGPRVAAALEALSVLPGGPRPAFTPRPLGRLALARTCYDHLAGRLGVSLHDRFFVLGWLAAARDGDAGAYDVTPAGARGLEALGVDLEAARALRRRFAYGCLDWSERRPHLGGAMGAALLAVALRKRWVARDLEGRALTVTRLGRRDMLGRFGLTLEERPGQRVPLAG